MIEKGKSGVLSAGSLSALDLHATAVSTLDTGRISHLLTNSTTLASLKSMIGKIIINASVWDGNCFSGLIRADKDAEVQTLCLVAFRCKNPRVSAACADLTFDFKELGLGSKQATATLKLLDNEDKLRAVMGISGWRKVSMLAAANGDHRSLNRSSIVGAAISDRSRQRPPATRDVVSFVAAIFFAIMCDQGSQSLVAITDRPL